MSTHKQRIKAENEFLARLWASTYTPFESATMELRLRFLRAILVLYGEYK